MALCFFFSTLDGILVFSTTDILSPNIMAGSSRGTPNIQSAYCISIINSGVTLAATSSDPYVDDSTVFLPFTDPSYWTFVYHDNYSSNRPSCYLIMCMICIYIDRYSNWFSFWCWHVMWYFFFYIWISFIPTIMIFHFIF